MEKRFARFYNKTWKKRILGEKKMSSEKNKKNSGDIFSFMCETEWKQKFWVLQKRQKYFSREIKNNLMDKKSLQEKKIK